MQDGLLQTMVTWSVNATGATAQLIVNGADRGQRHRGTSGPSAVGCR